MSVTQPAHIHFGIVHNVSLEKHTQHPFAPPLVKFIYSLQFPVQNPDSLLYIPPNRNIRLTNTAEQNPH